MRKWSRISTPVPLHHPTDFRITTQPPGPQSPEKNKWKGSISQADAKILDIAVSDWSSDIHIFQTTSTSGKRITKQIRRLYALFPSNIALIFNKHELCYGYLAQVCVMTEHYIVNRETTTYYQCQKRKSPFPISHMESCRLKGKKDHSLKKYYQNKSKPQAR